MIRAATDVDDRLKEREYKRRRGTFKFLGKLQKEKEKQLGKGKFYRGPMPIDLDRT